MDVELKKQNLFILLFIIILLFFTNKISFYNNLINLIKFNEEQRITNFYGYCHDESIGYLKYLKKRYKFDNNPEIVNFIHTPQTNWSIFDSRKFHKNSSIVIDKQNQGFHKHASSSFHKPPSKIKMKTSKHSE